MLIKPSSLNFETLTMKTWPFLAGTTRLAMTSITDITPRTLTASGAISRILAFSPRKAGWRVALTRYLRWSCENIANDTRSLLPLILEINITNYALCMFWDWPCFFHIPAICYPSVFSLTVLLTFTNEWMNTTTCFLLLDQQTYPLYLSLMQPS